MCGEEEEEKEEVEKKDEKELEEEKEVEWRYWSRGGWRKNRGREMSTMSRRRG